METIPSLDWLHHINNLNHNNYMGNLSSAKAKLKQKKTKKPDFEISEQNKMDPKKIEEMMKYKGDPDCKPVIEMEEGRVMPVYMFMASLKFVTEIGNSNLSFMASVVHNIKEKNLEIRGRMRYEDTGRKTVFAFPNKYKTSELLETQREIKRMYNDILKDLPFLEAKTYDEISFDLNETSESMIKKMNDSNLFNIGVAPIK